MIKNKTVRRVAHSIKPLDVIETKGGPMKVWNIFNSPSHLVFYLWDGFKYIPTKFEPFQILKVIVK